MSNKLLKVREKQHAHPSVQSKLLQKGFSESLGAGSPVARTSA